MSSRVVRWSEADGSADAFAQGLRAAHPGDLIDVRDADLASALEAGGAAITRRSLLMARPLTASAESVGSARSPGPDGGVVPMALDPARYASALLRAFPPEHPDYDPAIDDLVSAEAALCAYFAGDVIGPWIAVGSGEVRAATGEVAGGIVINRMPPHDTNPGGPWVTEVFVDPAHQGGGAGRALLDWSAARLAEHGEAVLWLAVQVHNPARHLYERAGFATDSSWSRFRL